MTNTLLRVTCRTCGTCFVSAHQQLLRDERAGAGPPPERCPHCGVRSRYPRAQYFSLVPEGRVELHLPGSTGPWTR